MRIALATANWRGWHIVVGTGGSSKSGVPNGIAAARQTLAPVGLTHPTVANADIERLEMAESIAFELNGETRTIEVAPDTPLLYVLRNELGLSNPHFGCGLAQCGACTVHVDGAPTRSCSLPVSAAAGTKVTTLAGLGTPDKPHPLHTAFIAEQVPQCGNCLNGWVMTTVALLEKNPHPHDGQIREALT